MQDSPLLPPVGVWPVPSASVAVCPLRPATDRRLGEPLPHQLANRPRAPLLARLLAFPSQAYAVLAPVSQSYSPLKGRLPTCYSPVRRCTQGLLPFLARLACVKRAASVDSEPGSNSRLIFKASPQLPSLTYPRGSSARTIVLLLRKPRTTEFYPPCAFLALLFTQIV